MKLKVMLPMEVIVDEEVKQVTAEAENGSFCLLPRHVDFVAALVPGLLSFVAADGHEEFIAVDGGTLVKCGPQVLVSTPNVARGSDLGRLQEAVDNQFRIMDEGRKMAQKATARLEAAFVRRFVELGDGLRV